ncbi:hypothetical protein AB0D54_15630 [Streptomyces xanthophaeus]|uniref:hypothetical protein n=1 Tax=Streptomyces xanthophaeus TaxID=67385 RepID=UPI00342B82B0
MPVRPVTRRSLIAGAVTAALPLAFLTPAAPAAATTCTGLYPVRIADGYASLYTESSQNPQRPSCSVVTNTATDGTALLIRSTDGLVEPTFDPCKTAYTTIKGFDPAPTPVPAPTPSPCAHRSANSSPGDHGWADPAVGFIPAGEGGALGGGVGVGIV